MTFRTLISTTLALSLLLSGPVLMAQEDAQGPTAPASLEEAEPGGATLPEEEALTYSDYTVKAYTITLFGGNFNGDTYLANQDLGPRTILAPPYNDIVGFNGEILQVSRDTEHYTGAHKEIESGPAFGGRIGIYISDSIHLDLVGTVASGEATTTMLFTPDPEADPLNKERIEVDRDTGYSMYKGGLALMYDANSAKIFGMVPRLGFGLGGIINSYTNLADVTGLYLEGNFGLNAQVAKNFQVGAQVDLTNFAFEVVELGYSNMVNYTTFSIGLTWFLDVLPPAVRAAHEADED